MSKKRTAKSASKETVQPETTGNKQEDGRSKTWFQPGQSGNPSGRKPGTRNKLCKRYIEDLQTVWQEVNESTGKIRGIEAIRAVAEERPTAFLQAVGNLVPKEFDLGDKTALGFRDLLLAVTTGKVPDLQLGDDDDED